MARVIACDNCGAVISSRYDYCPECNAKIKKHRGIWWLIIIAVVLAILFIPFGGDGTPGIMDRFMDLTQANDEHVRGVKYGSPNSYPDSGPVNIDIQPHQRFPAHGCKEHIIMTMRLRLAMALPLTSSILVTTDLRLPPPCKAK